ncbi:barstar family protein [Propionispora hippei]|uniref:Barstar (Barnase inhibitor) n=1 Tax=Propionispora hippei DSM 15287 TaxID=1123003 RepID=A0A1M6GZ98_9FIRM|nr:barstar family protein [Propionispora hippei]SHJ15252.1 Barstar (barnase inhibitor) [Propionispora hippei DSM 15287]
MEKKKVIIDGTQFHNIEGFRDEINKVLTKRLTWRTEYNLDAFNDFLRGGFGVHEYGEPIVIIWENAEKSRIDFGYNATIKHYERILTGCHPTNVNKVSFLLEDAKQKKGETLFEIIIKIIQSHDNIELKLK